MTSTTADKIMESCRSCSSQIPQLFADADAERAARLIASDRCDALLPDGPQDFVDHVASCADCPNDILWFLEIRDECDVRSFPCIHLAYASSGKANHVITREHGVFALATGARTAIVIGYCPWCGIELPVTFS